MSCSYLESHPLRYGRGTTRVGQNVKQQQLQDVSLVINDNSFYLTLLFVSGILSGECLDSTFGIMPINMTTFALLVSALCVHADIGGEHGHRLHAEENDNIKRGSPGGKHGGKGAGAAASSNSPGHSAQDINLAADATVWCLPI